MKASAMFAKSTVAPVAALGSALGHSTSSPRGGGSPLDAAPATPLNGGASSGASAASTIANVEEDEVSEYTDADESISAPTEFLAEFLSAIMGKDYPTALKYCKLILQYEPNNRTAREFYPLIVEKLVQNTIDEARTDSEDESSSSSGGSGSLTGSGSDEESSDLSEDEDDDRDDSGDGDEDGNEGEPRRRRRHNDNSSVEYGDTDGTTASYSSLEDEEAEPTTGLSGLVFNYNDNADAGNGNEVITGKDPLTRCSDSESPTEPVSQQLIGELRGRVVVNAHAHPWTSSPSSPSRPRPGGGGRR